METHGSQTPAVETIENGENDYTPTDKSTAISSIAVVDPPAVIRTQTNGFSKHALDEQSTEMPPEDTADIEVKDGEDVLKI